MKPPTTASRLRNILNFRGMRAQDLVEQSGVAKASISQYINGTHKPSNVSAGKMAAVLGVDPLWLMGFDVPMKTKNPVYEAAAGQGRISSAPIDTMDIHLRDDQEIATVVGRSMEPTLMDGDKVIIDRQSVLDRDGQIALVKIDGEANTLKRVQIMDDGILLVADNPDVFPPKFFTANQVETLPVRIMGVVSMLLREM